MRFELTWGASDEEVTHLERAEGLTSGDLEELSELLPDGRFEVAAGSVGKGAAGYGVALLIDVERAVADLASLAAIGGLLWKIIDRISRKLPGLGDRNARAP